MDSGSNISTTLQLQDVTVCVSFLSSLPTNLMRFPAILVKFRQYAHGKFLPRARGSKSLPSHEVEHIWRKEWNLSKILFIISRYGLLMDMPITIVYESEFILIYNRDRGDDDRNSIV